MMGQRGLLVDLAPETLVVELPLDEEEIVHDEGVDLGQLIDGPVEDVEGHVLSEVDLVLESVDVEEHVKGYVDCVPEWGRGYMKTGMKWSM